MPPTTRENYGTFASQLGKDNSRSAFPMTDEEIFEQIKRGEEHAFTELYDRYQAPLYRFAFHMTGSTTAAEDVTQEVFLTLLQSQKYESSKGGVAAYLFGIARHQIFRWLKKNRNFVSLPSSDLPADVVNENENLEAVRKAILTLPLKYREAVTLCDVHEKTYEEAAQLLKCAVGTVRSRLHRARALLLKKLTQKKKGVLYEIPAL